MQHYNLGGNLPWRSAITSSEPAPHSCPITAALTDVFVINWHKDVDSPLHPQQPQAEGHQQLEEDAAAGPHVRHEQDDLPPEALPGGLALLAAAQKALSWERRALGAVHEKNKKKTNKIKNKTQKTMNRQRGEVTATCLPFSTSRSSSLMSSMYGRRGRPGALRPRKKSSPVAV